MSTVDRGHGLPVGSAHYRAYVGPPEAYDVIGALQFTLLFALGLRETHSVLDIGCGSLRAGRLLIPYLLPGNYYGIEPNAWLVREGLERELGATAERVKAPTFVESTDFQLSVFGRSFDYLLAHAIFIHAAPPLIRRCMDEARRVLEPGGFFVATFAEMEDDHAGGEWVYPKCVGYRWPTFAGFAGDVGLRATRIDWPHPFGQTWAVVTHPEHAAAIPSIRGFPAGHRVAR